MSNDISASIGLDTRDLRYGVSSALGDLTRLGGAVGRLARELQREQQALTLTRDEIMQNRIATARMTDAQRQVLLQTLQYNQALRDQAAAQERVSKMGGGFSLGSAMALAGGTSGILSAIDSWTTLQNRLKLVHESSADVALAQAGILKIAKETGSSLTETAAAYQNFASNQRELGLSTQEMIDLTATINKSISLGGASADAAANALQQFGQAMASGVLRGDEFNSVMEQTPTLMQTVAKGLGVNTGQLRQMANDGKLTAEVVVNALKKMKNQVDGDFAKTAMTVGQSFEVLKTHFVEFVGQSSEKAGAVKILSGAILTLSENIDLAVYAFGALAAVKLTTWLAVSAAGLAQNVAALIAVRQAAIASTAANAANSVSIATTGTAAQIAAMEVTGFSGALGVLRLSATSSAVAMQGLQARMVAFGSGVGGTILAGVAAITASFTALKSAVNFSQGKAADNWLSDYANKIADTFGVIDSRFESLGTKLFDFVQQSGGLVQAALKMVNPIWHIRNLLRENTAELSKQVQLMEAVEAKVGYKSVAKQLDNSGSVAQFKAENLKVDDLKKALSETIVKYREQNEQIGKTKQELELMRLETEKEVLLKKQKAAFEKEYQGQSNKDELVAQSMTKFTAEMETDFQAAKQAIADFATQTQIAEKAEKQAAQAAQNRAKIDETVANLAEKLQTSGKTADEVERLKLASAGATQAQLRQIAALQTAVSLQEKQNAVNASLGSLQDEISKIGKSAKEIKLMDFQKQGASDGQLKQAAALLDLQAAREKEFQLTSQTFQAATQDFSLSTDEQRSYISESWAREKARIDAANAAAQAELDFQAALRQTQTEQIAAKVSENQIFEKSVNGFQDAVSQFAQSAQNPSSSTNANENSVMQKISLDFTLPNGKVLGGIVLADSQFVNQVKNISVQAVYNEIAKQATAKS